MWVRFSWVQKENKFIKNFFSFSTDFGERWTRRSNPKLWAIETIVHDQQQFAARNRCVASGVGRDFLDQRAQWIRLQVNWCRCWWLCNRSSATRLFGTIELQEPVCGINWKGFRVEHHDNWRRRIADYSIHLISFILCILTFVLLQMGCGNVMGILVVVRIVHLV